jgi:DnaJ-class molecular chaperone
MNLQEALKLLELPADFNEELLKKQFRKLAAKYHPDVNKEPDAEEKSKKLSEANSFLKEYLHKPKDIFEGGYTYTNRPSSTYYNINFDNFNDLFEKMGGFSVSGQHNIIQEDQYFVDITLEEAVTGCKKTIERTRTTLCAECVKVSDQPCKSCDGKKVITKQENINLTIPPTTTFQYVNFTSPNAGNYNTKTRRYNSLKISTKISQHKKFTLRNSTICYKQPLKINLLQIIEGDVIKLETLSGETEVFFAGKKSNIDKELIFLHKGISYAIPVVIEYPENVSQLVKTLKENYGFSTTMSQS